MLLLTVTGFTVAHSITLSLATLGFVHDGAFYAPVPHGYQVIPPPVGSTVADLPSGAVPENVKGTTYFRYGNAYYQPFYSGSSVIYEVVAKPS